MNVLLIDHLVCPRCGPPFGLVLLARDVQDRRVLAGELGCPNCRDAFEIRDGFVDLRPPPRSPPPPPEEEGVLSAPEDPMRLAAALGVTEGPGTVVLFGGHTGAAPELARLVAGVEVVTVSWSGRGLDRSPGVSPMIAGPGLPLRDLTVRGAVIGSSDLDRWWPEIVRVLAPGARTVVTGAGPEAREHMAAAGFQILLEESGTLVGRAPDSRARDLSRSQNQVP